ncbi:cytochrome b/b6 domain-containing protein [Candidatus Formimonas warabiya]|uniref:Cytochrome b561 bacterial/Ni-hydrogenase domain-containing protein n=1 Tax=Formimonas warabiya TaxID=1761012 RepID=A0A3G1KUT2_FORW1|nr:cytochrome b/b6 domain-containing protein [Candidatus Formimonas warabiya]ATW26209.1 hypothetical protein DCMF_16830 [Candidatus Formimonas warabiya]
MSKKVPSTITQPLGIRLLHWSLACTVTLLIATGFYRAHPGWLDISLRTVRLIHSSAGFLLLIIVPVFTLYHILSGTWKDVFFLPQDLKKSPAFLKYVFFLRKSCPSVTKYNPGQKAIYTSWFFLFILQLITGFMLYTHTFFSHFSMDRVIYLHYAATFGFVTILIHIYFVLTEDPAKLQSMFTGREKDP